MFQDKMLTIINSVKDFFTYDAIYTNKIFKSQSVPQWIDKSVMWSIGTVEVSRGFLVVIMLLIIFL